MKCEIEYQKYKNLTLSDPNQLKRHQKKRAFQLLLEMARQPDAYVVKCGGEQVAVHGSALVWGRTSDENLQAVKSEFSLSHILSTEQIVSELIRWGDETYKSFIGEYKDWNEELFRGLLGEPVSIKTITSKDFSGVKIVWTVDTQKAKEFCESYYPYCDILLVRINWDGLGGFYYVPLEAQRRLFDEIGRRNYIKLPKPGTNPRGVEFTKEALASLVEDSESQLIEISWERRKIDFNLYKRWVDLWREE